MFSPLLPRLSIRLLVPALALGAIVLLGEPLPAEVAGEPAEKIEVLIATSPSHALALALQREADALREEAEATRATARQSAAQMRWFLTLPAASSRRCLSPACAS